MTKHIILTATVLLMLFLLPLINYGQETAGISTPTYNVADYDETIIITTSADVIDASDDNLTVPIISYREACIKAKGFLTQNQGKSVLVLFNSPDGLCEITPDHPGQTQYNDFNFWFDYLSGIITFDMHEMATVEQGIKYIGDIDAPFNYALRFYSQSSQLLQVNINNLIFKEFNKSVSNTYAVLPIFAQSINKINIEHCLFLDNINCGFFNYIDNVNLNNNKIEYTNVTGSHAFKFLFSPTLLQQNININNNIINGGENGGANGFSINNLWNASYSPNVKLNFSNNTLINNHVGILMKYPLSSWIFENNIFTNNENSIYILGFNYPDNPHAIDGLILNDNSFGSFNANNELHSETYLSFYLFGFGVQIYGGFFNAPICITFNPTSQNNYGPIIRGVKIDINGLANMPLYPGSSSVTSIIDFTALEATTNAIKGYYKFKTTYPFYSVGGEYAVDFYLSNSDGDFVEYLGYQIHSSAQLSNSYVKTIVFPTGITINEGDRIAATVTSLGSSTVFARGTSTAHYANVVAPVITLDKSCAGSASQLSVGGAISGISSYSWIFPDETTSTLATPSYTFPELGSYTVSVSLTLSNGLVIPVSQSVTIYDCICCENNYTLSMPETGEISLTTDQRFYTNILTGDIVFVRDGCPIQYPFECFGDKPMETLLDNVISATATVYSDELVDEKNIYIYGNTGTGVSNNANIFERGEANKWYVHRQYVFREELDAAITGNNAQVRNYNKGTFTLSGFNWDKLTANDIDHWIWTNQFNCYSPNGKAIEDENILGIHSSAQYGYNYTLLTAVTQNAEQLTSYFYNFENVLITSGVIVDENTQAHYESSGTISSDIAHTGHNSISLKHNMSSAEAFWLGRIKCNERIMNEGYLIRIWVHINKNALDIQNGDLQIYTNLADVDIWTYNNVPVNMHKVASAGEWMLYEAVYGTEQLNAINQGNNPLYINFGLNLKNTGNYADGDIHIDDVKIQPFLSEMTCYVYDNMQRITAAFDDQHFATIYQYNAEGDLVRKLKETVEGIKTISETQYNSRKIDR